MKTTCKNINNSKDKVFTSVRYRQFYRPHSLGLDGVWVMCGEATFDSDATDNAVKHLQFTISMYKEIKFWEI